MARHEFLLDDPQKTYGFDLPETEPLLSLVNNGLQLAKLDSGGLWAPDGVYTTTSILVHTWSPRALRSMIGFCAFGDEPAGTSMLFRMSTDAGPQLYWDGAVWRAPVDNTEWNTELELDTGVSTFPLSESMSFHIKLTSTTGEATPLFFGFYVFWEGPYDPSTDLIESLFDKLSTEVDITGEWTLFTATPVAAVTLADRLFAIADPVEVFNLTTDPFMRTDLFASRVGDVVQLTAVQTGDLLVRYRGRLAETHIASDADFALERLPAVVIRNVLNPRVRDVHLHTLSEPLRSQGLVRVRTYPSRHTYTYKLVCTAFDDRTSKRISDAVRRAFDTREFVRSLALDEDLPLVALENVIQVNIVDQQLWERTVELSVSVLEWMPEFEDVPMALTVEHNLRTICGLEFSTPE